MNTKLRALVGGVALLLVLAACYPGVSSQGSLSYEVQATITKGKVDLDHGVFGSEGFIDPDGLQGPYDFNRSMYAGNGTASVDLNFAETTGNWSVTGRWIDGPVRMEFSGKSEYLTALLNHCLSSVSMNDLDSQLWYWEIQGDSWGYDFDATDCGYFEGEPEAPGYVDDVQKSKWIKGGCAYIPTLYRSLNSQYVGTGHALIFVCQNGGDGNPITGAWENPSYIEIWIPDTTWISEQAIGDVNYLLNGDEDANDVCGNLLEGYYVCGYAEDEYYFSSSYEDNVYYTKGYFENDNSPFRNYLAGGVNTNRSGKWTVQARFNNLWSLPLPVESPLFNSSYWNIP